MGVRAYLAKDDHNIFIISGMGNLMYLPINKILDKEELIFKKINTNFFDVAIAASKNIYHRNIVKNILIKKNKIYVSYYKR